MARLLLAHPAIRLSEQWEDVSNGLAVTSCDPKDAEALCFKSYYP
jgi:hypothetical protein